MTSFSISGSFAHMRDSTSHAHYTWAKFDICVLHGRFKVDDARTVGKGVAMNRIFKYTGKKSDDTGIPFDLPGDFWGNPDEQRKIKSIDDIPDIADSVLCPPKNAPDRCGFCGEPIKGSLFTVWTTPELRPKVAMCRDCVEKFAVMARFTHSFSWYFRTPVNYAPFQQKLLRRLAGEGGSAALKGTVVELALRTLKRSSAIFGGNFDICPKTGVSLAKGQQFAIIGADLECAPKLMQITCHEIGIFFKLVSKEGLASGQAYMDFSTELLNSMYAEHGILMTDCYVKPMSRSTVVFVGEDESKFPPDVEKVFVMERK